MREVLITCERNERCFPGGVWTLPQNLVARRPGNRAQSWSFVPAAASTPKLLGLAGSTKTSSPFPSTPFLNSLSVICTFVQQLLVFPQIFSKFQAFQLSVRNLVKNDKNISLGEFASTKDDGLYITGGKEILSFVCSVCQAALPFEQILKNEFDYKIFFFFLIGLLFCICHCRLQVARELFC